MLSWLRGRLERRLETLQGEPVDDVPKAAAPRTARDLLDARAFDEAAASAATTLASDPSNVEALRVTALVAFERGRIDDATRLVRQALAVAPDDVDVLVASGRIDARAGRAEAARRAFARALERDPSSGDAHLGLGLLALAAGRNDAASGHLQAALRCAPGLADAHARLADLARSRDDVAGAEQGYRRAIEHRPDHADALCNLGGIVNDRGRVDEAAALFERAVAADPGLAPALYNLALIRIDRRRWSDAADLLARAVASDGRDADAWYWLGNARMGCGDAAAARDAYAAAYRLRADHVQARWGHAMAELPAIAKTDDEQCEAPRRFTKELDRLARWIRSHPSVDAMCAVGAQQPFYLAYVPGNHRAALHAYGQLVTSVASRWSRKAGVPAPAPATASATPARCRLGIVSAHIHSHSVWHALVRGWVEHLDPAAFELHLFHVGDTLDAETDWASRRVAQLHFGIGAWGDWAKRLSDSRLDVILYPEIAMDATTLRLASLRLARVQLAAWGHPVTTGLPTIDGYLSAEAFEPDDADAQYVERLIRLPRLGSCYRPYGTRPTPPDLAASGLTTDDRFVVCAGTAFKYAPRHDGVLVALAQRCAPCKLVFFATSPEPLGAAFESRLRRAFDAAGVVYDAHVRIVPWQSQARFFGLLDRADVFVDSIEFSGFNTAMQAVERGVPIVAWKGAAMRGRFASAILEALQLDAWVASNEEDFVASVARLCADQALRREVRQAIEARRASLYDDRTTVDALADHLRLLAAA